MPMLQGKAYYAKIVGKPVDGYGGTFKEWCFDVALDKATVKLLTSEGCGHQIKNKGDERGDFITFRRKSINFDGEPAKPFAIVDAKREPWGKELIGNGSVINVIYAINENMATKKPKASAIKVQVWEHIPYEGKDDLPVKDHTGTEEWNED